MEASEKAGMSPEGSGGAALHRIDPGLIPETLRSDKHADGFSRLELMLNQVLPRLAGETPGPRRG